jgi:hypothetical protein
MYGGYDDGGHSHRTRRAGKPTAYTAHKAQQGTRTVAAAHCGGAQGNLPAQCRRGMWHVPCGAYASDSLGSHLSASYGACCNTLPAMTASSEEGQKACSV